MGGVDLFDQFVATYRVRIRSKKWWWPFFAWSVNAAMVNAWLLYHQVKEPKIKLIDFERYVVLKLLASFGRNDYQISDRILEM